jgi:hypothetical protein
LPRDMTQGKQSFTVGVMVPFSSAKDNIGNISATYISLIYRFVLASFRFYFFQDSRGCAHEKRTVLISFHSPN